MKNIYFLIIISINIYFLIIISIGLLSCNATKKVTTSKAFTTDADQKIAASMISINKIKAHIHYLASDEMKGRDTPSPELDIAARLKKILKTMMSKTKS